MWLFLILFIINLPVMLVYRSSTVNYNENNRFTTFLSRMSIGNLEQVDPYCTYTDTSDQGALELRCMSDLGFLSTIKGYGLSYARDIQSGGVWTEPTHLCD
jgi:hypothetical protein